MSRCSLATLMTTAAATAVMLAANSMDSMRIEIAVAIAAAAAMAAAITVAAKAARMAEAVVELEAVD